MTQGQRLRGRFLISLVSKQGEEENQRRKKERKGKREKEEKREKEREAGRSDFPRSLALRWSKFVGSRVKVGIRDESDAWVPKSRNFAKVQSYRSSGNQGFLHYKRWGFSPTFG